MHTYINKTQIVNTFNGVVMLLYTSVKNSGHFPKTLQVFNWSFGYWLSARKFFYGYILYVHGRARVRVEVKLVLGQ